MQLVGFASVRTKRHRSDCLKYLGITAKKSQNNKTLYEKYSSWTKHPCPIFREPTEDLKSIRKDTVSSLEEPRTLLTDYETRLNMAENIRVSWKAAATAMKEVAKKLLIIQSETDAFVSAKSE